MDQRGQYGGPSYSVKYLGIVDGSMGVLSRKMALLNYNQARNQHTGISNAPPASSINSKGARTQVPVPQAVSSLSSQKDNSIMGQSSS